MTSRTIALLALLPTVLALTACGIERRHERREDRREDRQNLVSQITKARHAAAAAVTAVGRETATPQTVSATS